MRRNRKTNDGLLEDLVWLIEGGVTVDDACRRVGISHTYALTLANRRGLTNITRRLSIQPKREFHAGSDRSSLSAWSFREAVGA